MVARSSLKWSVVWLLIVLSSVVLVPPAYANASSERPLVLDAYSPRQHGSPAPASSRSTLARGGLYVATVRGSVSFYAAIDYIAPQTPFHVICGAPGRAPMFSSAGGSGQVGTDAEFIFALPLTTRSCAHARLPRTYANFQANVGHGWTHPNVLSPQTLVKPSRSHTYEFALTGAGKPVSFRLVESDARDDYGSFRIYLRPAAPGDCSAHGSQAFGLARAACLASTAHGTTPPRLPAVPKLLSIDQSPIARVLRSSDVPSRNQEVPSGALTVSQFATLNNPSRSTARAEARLLQGVGFRSAAISQFASPRLPSFKSTAVKLSSSRQALSALQGEAALVSRSQAPVGAMVTVGPDTNFAHASLVTFTPAARGVGGLELLASAGNYLYTLTVLAKPDTVSRPTEEQLLRVLLARGVAGRQARATPGVLRVRVPSPSMEPTLHLGEVVTVDPRAYRARNPAVGDIVLFHPPAGADPLTPVCGNRHQGGGHAQVCSVPTRRESKEEFIKRVVALPGDRISIKNGHVIRNGVREHDPYIAACRDDPSCNFRKAVRIPSGDYFVLGDNRGASDDSRFWGPVHKSWIVGKMIRR